VSEWLSLASGQGNPTPAALPPAPGSPRQTAPPATENPTTPTFSRKFATTVRAGIFSPRILLALAVVGVALLSLSLLRGGGSGGSFQRGFADSIIRYADRSYDGAQWKEIYSGDNLRPGWGNFKNVRGWDDSNFALLGTGGVGGTVGPLLVLFRPGMKDLAEAFDGGGYAFPEVIDARFLDSEHITLLYQSPQANTAVLATKGPKGLQKLGTESANGSTRLALLAPDILLATGEFIDPWRFSEGKFSKADKESQDYYVRRENNVVAVSGHESLEAEHITSITTLAAGKAVGLWTYDYHNAVAIVRYENGRWLLAQELQGFSQRHCPTRAWFLDDRNMVAVGSPKVVQVKDGNVTEHSVTLDSKPVSGEELIAVWGNSPDKFWVADKKGNVFAFSGGNIIPVVRGPEFKGQNDREERFTDIWVSPSGTVFAISSKNRLYQLK
jgi:hypothetical protein